MEGQIAIDMVLPRMPEVRLKPPLSEGWLENFPWSDDPVFDGQKSLPVAF